MQWDEVLKWLLSNQGLAAWWPVLAVFPFLWRYIHRAYSRRASRLEAFRLGSAMLDKASSELVIFAKTASNAGGPERRALATRARDLFDAIHTMELSVADPVLKAQLANAADGVRAFERAVINWHGEHDCDNTQREAGMAAIQRVELSADKLRSLL